MRIFLQPLKGRWMDGVYTHQEDLREVLTKRGHYLVNSVEEKHDIAFKYNLDPSPGAPTLLHVHNYDIGHLLDRLDAERFYSVNSEFQKLQFPIDIDKIFVLPNYVNESKYIPTYVEKKDKSIILLGRVQEENFDRIRQAIMAMCYLPDYTLDITGWIFDSGRDFVERLISKFELKNVHLIGEKRGGDKIDFICAHTIGMGVGRAMMEMTLLGLPVLVFGHSWGGWITPELINRIRFDNYSTRSLPGIDDADIVNAIVESVRAPRILNRAVAYDEFGLMNNIWKYESVFEKVIRADFRGGI